MSVKIIKSNITKDDIDTMERKLLVSKDHDSNSNYYKKNNHYTNSEKIPFYRIENNILYVPFHFGRNHFLGRYENESIFSENIDCSFFGKLRSEQEIVKSEALNTLSVSKSVLLSCYPGFGKTTLTLKIITDLKKKTVIVVNKVAILEQWKNEIKKYIGIEPVILKSKLKENSKIPNSFIYLVNCINIEKHDFSSLNIGTVVVDECHLMLTKVFSKALLHLSPIFLIGLSATSYRYDGFDKLFDLYFGYNRIHRSLHREHKVIQILSNERINHSLSSKGSINWNSVIEHQSISEKRRNTICNLCIGECKDRNIMILCKRIKQMTLIQERLVDLGINKDDVSLFKQNDIIFNKNSRILITSYQKAGVGFSHNKLDCLILGSDTKDYFIQYLGRVFRTPEVTPLIVDIVDDHPLLKRHFYERKKVYIECGGTIEKRIQS